jgi:hypothetical protein
VKTISNPQSAKLKHFATMQEALRKDVERCFGVLKSRFAILNCPARIWDVSMLKKIWTAAVILHNMILEDDRNSDQHQPLNVADNINLEGDFEAFRKWRIDVSSWEKSRQLRSDLIDHLWNLKGSEE